jgi:hypothetical protein
MLDCFARDAGTTKSAEKFTKEKVAVLLLWFGVLIGIRILFF